MRMSPGFEQRGDLLDDLIDRGPGLDHDHHLARPLQDGDQFLDGVAADDVLALGPAGDEVVHAGLRCG